VKWIYKIVVFSALLLIYSRTVDARILPNYNEWVNVGGGVTYPVHGKWSHGYSKNVSYNFGRKLFYQVSFSLSDGNIGSDKRNYNLNSFGFCCGRRLVRKYFLMAAFAGPSYNWGKVEGPDMPWLVNHWGSTNGPGIMTNLQINFRHPHLAELGFGLEFFSNFNRAKNNYGIRFSLCFSDGK